MIRILLVMLAANCRAAPAAQNRSREIIQDITIRSKSDGPALSVPSPTPSKPVIDEVLQSLDLGRDGGDDKTLETVRVAPNTARFTAPFPEPPFLSLSPENIRAMYDSWIFEIREVGGEIVERSEGVGALRETLDWDGAGPDGRIEIKPGRRYAYRFMGRRGSRQFLVASDPVALNSFTRREYGGETRLEVAIEEIFVPGRADFATGAERYLNRMALVLRGTDPRPDGTYRFELYSAILRGSLLKSRVNALTERLAVALGARTNLIRISPLPIERSEAFAAFAPPTKGPALRD